jgi:GT2 family glycosyltransferase
MAGRGPIRVTLFVADRNAASITLSQTELTLGEKHFDLEIAEIDKLPGELLSVEISAPDADAVLTSLSWITPDAPRREVRLAIAVPTFNREASVQAAVARFQTAAMTRPTDESFHLFIVNNGREIEIGSSQYVTLIRNNNLGGGSGGFARGLAEVIESKRFTHCLFMDDDAVCEPESIWRSRALLAYSIDARTSVAGAMLYEDDPAIQYEKGAVIGLRDSSQPTWFSLNHHYDLANLKAVAKNDLPDTANYGGFWFLAFPLSAVEHFPFPFFVRGDDVDFCLSNGLKIVTLNGVATWCENFAYKSTPAVLYLAWRSWLALVLMYGNTSLARRTLREGIRLAVKSGYCFDYAGMGAILRGLIAALEGPRVLADNAVLLKEISNLKQRTNQVSIEPSGLSDFASAVDAGFFDEVLCFLSLGGHLIPSTLRGGKPRYTRFAQDANEASLTRANLFVFGARSDLRGLKRSSGLFRELMVCLRLRWTPRYKLSKLCDDYRREGNAYRTPSYWMRQLRINRTGMFQE